MRVYNLTDVNRTALKGGTQALAIWKHRVAEPGGYVSAPGLARLDPRLKDLARRGAIAFEELPLEYLQAKGTAPPAPEPPPPPPNKKAFIKEHKKFLKATLAKDLEELGIDPGNAKKADMAAMLYDARYGGS